MTLLVTTPHYNRGQSHSLTLSIRQSLRTDVYATNLWPLAELILALSIP